jgi:hypothetical protein
MRVTLTMAMPGLCLALGLGFERPIGPEDGTTATAVPGRFMSTTAPGAHPAADISIAFTPAGPRHVNVVDDPFTRGEYCDPQ